MIKKVISDFSFEDYQKIAKDNTVKQGKVFSQGFLQNYNSKLPLVLYEYGILGGLQVSKPSPEGRLVTIRCAEFSKTPPNTTNLIVKYSVIREGKLITNKLTWKAQLISQSFVVIDLKEEKITDKAIRIDATFTDKEDEEFEGYSETVEYKNALTKIARERGSGYWPIYGLREVKR